MHFQVAPDEQLNNTLQKIWDLESLGIATEESPVSANDDSVILKFKENLTRQDGRYMVPIPWKDQHAELKDNYQQAETRLRSLEKKLIRDPARANSHQKAINKYVADGIAEEVSYDQIVPEDGLLFAPLCCLPRG